MKRNAVILLLSLVLFISGCSPSIDEGETYTCTVKISCEEILSNIDKLDESKISLVPKDGILLADYTVRFTEGQNVFEIIQTAVKENNIHMESSVSAAFNTAYIEGIGNLYEFDCGAMSGWMYSVNGKSPSIGCSLYTAEDGDSIEVYYTCSLKQQN